MPVGKDRGCVGRKSSVHTLERGGEIAHGLVRSPAVSPSGFHAHLSSANANRASFTWDCSELRFPLSAPGKLASSVIEASFQLRDGRGGIKLCMSKNSPWPSDALSTARSLLSSSSISEGGLGSFAGPGDFTLCDSLRSISQFSETHADTKLLSPLWNFQLALCGSFSSLSSSDQIWVSLGTGHPRTRNCISHGSALSHDKL